MKQEFHEVNLYFDPVTDTCVGAVNPAGEQYWLAGASETHPISGRYRLPFSCNTCSSCDPGVVMYHFVVYPLGKTAEELREYAVRPKESKKT